MSFQECMPAQQISPSAASRSPWPAATAAASRKVAAIVLVFAEAFSRHLLIPNSAESMRITPYFRTPCSLKILAIRQALRTASMNFARCTGLPMAESPTVPGQIGATSDPTAKP